jgi:hypothetical protein
MAQRKRTEDFYPEHVDVDQLKARRELKKLDATRMPAQERKRLGPALTEARDRAVGDSPMHRLPRDNWRNN